MDLTPIESLTLFKKDFALFEALSKLRFLSYSSGDHSVGTGSSSILSSSSSVGFSPTSATQASGLSSIVISSSTFISLGSERSIYSSRFLVKKLVQSGF